MSLALQDIETYSGWAQNSTVKGLGMQGIFLDETPAQYNNASAQFLDTVAVAIRTATGFGSDPLVSSGDKRARRCEVRGWVTYSGNISRLVKAA